MEKKIKRYAILNLIGVIIIIVCKAIQTYFIIDETFINRRITAMIGAFIIIPTLIISSILFIIIMLYYKRNKFKVDLFSLYLIIPYVLMLIFITYILVKIIILSVK